MAATNNAVKWIESSKGRPMLIVNDYMFANTGKGKQPGVIYWKCVQCCGAVAKTDGQTLVSLQGIAAPPDHGHPNDCAEIKTAGLKLSAN